MTNGAGYIYNDDTVSEVLDDRELVRFGRRGTVSSAKPSIVRLQCLLSRPRPVRAGSNGVVRAVLSLSLLVYVRVEYSD